MSNPSYIRRIKDVPHITLLLLYSMQAYYLRSPNYMLLGNLLYSVPFQYDIHMNRMFILCIYSTCICKWLCMYMYTRVTSPYDTHIYITKVDNWHVNSIHFQRTDNILETVNECWSFRYRKMSRPMGTWTSKLRMLYHLSYWGQTFPVSIFWNIDCGGIDILFLKLAFKMSTLHTGHLKHQLYIHACVDIYVHACIYVCVCVCVLVN